MYEITLNECSAEGAELDRGTQKNGVYFAIVSRFYWSIRGNTRAGNQKPVTIKRPAGPTDGQRARLDTISGNRSRRGGLYSASYPARVFSSRIRSSDGGRPSRRQRPRRPAVRSCFSCFANPSDRFLLLYCITHARTRTRSRRNSSGDHRPPRRRSGKGQQEPRRDQSARRRLKHARPVWTDAKRERQRSPAAGNSSSGKTGPARSPSSAKNLFYYYII